MATFSVTDLSVIVSDCSGGEGISKPMSVPPCCSAACPANSSMRKCTNHTQILGDKDIVEATATADLATLREQLTKAKLNLDLVQQGLAGAIAACETKLALKPNVG